MEDKLELELRGESVKVPGLRPEKVLVLVHPCIRLVGRQILSEDEKASRIKTISAPPDQGFGLFLLV